MAGSLILDTSFLIDLEREARAASGTPPTGAPRRARPTPAQDFLKARPEERLNVSITTLAELAIGTEDRERWEASIAPFGVLDIDADTCWQYSRAYRYLANQGKLIGSNDLWIAATAISHESPVVTRDVEHFSRVPGLRVLRYRKESSET